MQQEDARAEGPDCRAEDARAVVAFLRAHPEFLAENPGLYDGLTPPVRVHGAAVTDHMAAMLRRARVQADAAAADRRAADGFTRRVQDAVLALMRAADPAFTVAHELPALLQMEGVRLCSEGAQAGAAGVSAGTVAAVLGRRAAVMRAGTRDPALHGEVAGLVAREALVRVGLAGGPALLALAAREPGGLEGATTDALVFLAAAVASAFERGGG